MSGKDRRKYLTATLLDQDLLDWSHDNLDCRLEIVCDIETTDGIIRISDRNKYIVTDGVGYFYQARTNIPVISRTIGDWLVPDITFSTVTIEISNVDGWLNKYLPGGANYAPWINKNVTVRMGLAELGSSYFPIFSGRITDVAGYKRSIKSITVIARDVFDSMTREFPRQVLTKSANTFPHLEDSNVGKYLPIIYGDWTVSLDPDAAVIPALAINGADPSVIPEADGVVGADVELIVTNHNLTYFDQSNVYLKANDEYVLVPSSEITMVGTGNNRFKIKQGGIWRNGEAYKYASGDAFYVRVKGKDLGQYSNNIVWQARDILLSFGGVIEDQFDQTWVTYRDKTGPTGSDIANIKSRIFENEPTSAIQFALSLLEQVRLEAFISRDQKLKINSLHFEDWQPKDFTLTNFDIVQGSFEPSLDERNNFNRARGTFDFHPSRGESAQSTPLYKNQAAITQIGGKEISKQISFPNLYEPQTVADQVKGILKIASASIEVATISATWRSALLDIGDIITLNINIGSVIYENVPAMVREIGYDPDGLKLPLKLWVLQMLPFNSSQQTYAGTTGGYNANITEG